MARYSLARVAASSCCLLMALWLLLTPAADAAPPAVSLRTFRGQVSAAQEVAAACRAGFCDSRNLPGDEDVQPENVKPGFHAGWQWLHDAVDHAAGTRPAERSVTMEAAVGRLNEWATQTADTAAPSPAAAALPIAHRAAARILARDEFRADAGPTWLDHQIARLQDALMRLLLGMAGVGARNAWVAPLVEWLCFGLLAAGLLFLIRRSLGRQALRIALAGTAPAAGAGARSATDWIGAADLAEARGNGREVLHCLYWAAVASLEASKAWRPNPTRTPREYLRLLRSGSATQTALGALTHRFEQAWYGSAEPNATDIQAARTDLAAIQASTPDRVPGRQPSTGNLLPVPLPRGTAG